MDPIVMVAVVLLNFGLEMVLDGPGLSEVVGVSSSQCRAFDVSRSISGSQSSTTIEIIGTLEPLSV